MGGGLCVSVCGGGGGCGGAGVYTCQEEALETMACPSRQPRTFPMLYDAWICGLGGGGGVGGYKVEVGDTVEVRAVLNKVLGG